MLALEEARRQVLAPLRPLDPEVVALADAAGRVLAEAVVARDCAPPFDAAEMDGYAVQAASVASAADSRPVALPVAGEIAAGETFALSSLEAGKAARIMTGAPIPPGADAILPREWTREGGAVVEVLRPAAPPGTYIRRRGADYRRGDAVLAPGVRLSSAAVGLAVGAGAESLTVYRRPVVAILATGDELLEPGSALRPGAIRETSRLVLAGLVRGAGGAPIDAGIARDEPADLERKLRAALERADVLVTTGGISVGERDLVRATLAKMGVESRFWRVAVRPGKPFAFGMLGPDAGGHRPKAVFGLPGNPASSFVTFHLFVAPAIRRLQGIAAVDPLWLLATLDADVTAPPDRRTFLRARLRSENGLLRVRALADQAAGAQRSLAEANALLVVPEGAGRLVAGARVRVEPLDWPDPEACS